jgi:undecaprenyl-diphosphatase
MTPPHDAGLDYGTAAILGTLQGLAEFLPISSKGHLIIAERALGVHFEGVGFEVALHIGTLVAVVLYYARDLAALAAAVPATLGALARGRRPADERGTTLVALALGTLPAVVAALAFGDVIAAHFHDVRISLAGFALTGLVLWTTRRAGPGSDAVTLPRGLLVGVAQSAALLPGVSRSGSTIGAGVAAGLSRAAAARFSFLLSIPTVLGAIAHSLPAIASGETGARLEGPLLLGIAVSFAVGLAAIHILLRIAQRNRLDLFSWYLWALALAGLVVFR